MSLAISARETRARETVKAAERAEKLADKATKTAQEAAEAEIQARIFDPEQAVSESELLVALRERKITGDQHKRLTDLRRAEEGADSSEIVLSIERDIPDADPTIPERVAAGRTSGDISQKTASELLLKFDQAKRKGGALEREDVKRGRRFVDEVIGGVRGPLAILDTAESERVARALRDYDAKVQLEAVKGEDFDPNTIADEIVQKYRIAPPSPATFPRPRFLAGTRATPNIDATRKATLEALERGEINAAAAAEELRNLENIERVILERQNRTERK